jgi:hypothetical protein
MGGSIRIESVREEGITETEAIKELANRYGCYRIYKLGNEHDGWSHYKPIDYPEEERQVLSDAWDYVLLVYDRRKGVKNVDNLWGKSPLVTKKRWWQFWK